MLERNLADFESARKNLYGATLEAAKGIQPIVVGDRELRLADVDYDAKDDEDAYPDRYDYTAQSDAIANRSTLGRRLRGTWNLIDTTTGNVLEQRRHTLAVVPRLNEDGTMIYRGRRYAILNQQRVKPSVYALVKKNAEIESFCNPASGTGTSHRYILNPETGIFSINVGHSRVPLAPFLRTLGVSDDEMKAAWGDELAAKNFEKNDRGSLQKLYDRMVPKRMQIPGATEDQQRDLLRQAVAASKLDRWATKRMTGVDTDQLSPQVILAATKKVIALARQEGEADDRDHLAYQTIHTVEDLLPERIRLDRGQLVRRMGRDVIRRGSLKSIPPRILQQHIQSGIFESSLGVQPEMANPLDAMDRALRMTKMGEGGLSSIESVPMESREVHMSQQGFIDPARSTESLKVGIDTNVVSGVVRGADGILRTPVFNVKTGKREYKSPEDLVDASVAFSANDHEIPGYLAVSRKGQFEFAKPEEVDYIMAPPEEGMLSHLSNLIPGKFSSVQNRLAMGSRFVSQALPLKEPETPWVQSAMPGTNRQASYESHYGKRVGAVHAPVGGVVKSIEPNMITLETPEGLKRIPLHKSTQLGAKTRLVNRPLVSVGDQVEPEQLLATSNFANSKGQVAMGRNARVALMPYGDNYEDAFTISETFAKKLTSDHAYHYRLRPEDGWRLGKKDYIGSLPSEFNRDQLSKLGDDGVIQVGQKVSKGDPLILAAAPRRAATNQRITRKSGPSFGDQSLTWDHEVDGVVADIRVLKNGERVVQVACSVPMQVGDKCCYDGETEILTTRGWVKMPDVRLDDEVATLANGQQLVYMQPEALHRYDHEGPMYRVVSTQVDLLVTDNHKLYAAPRSHKHSSGFSEYQLIEAVDLFGKRYRMKRDATWIGKSPKTVRLPGYRINCGTRKLTSGVQQSFREQPARSLPTKDFTMLLGCYLSEGSLVWDEKGGSYGIDICQTKEPNRSDLIARLEGTGISVNFTGDKLRLYSQQFAKYFRQFGKCQDKFIPQQVFRWGVAELQELFKWLMWGDGHTNVSGRPINYKTTSKQLADDVQRLALHLGYSANITMMPAHEEWVVSRMCWVQDAYTVAIFTKKQSPTINHSHVKTQSAQTEEWVNFSGSVYCVTMPEHHVIYVRRNGKPVWCGNSDRYGAKGVVNIVPDEQMLQDKDGNPFDIVASDLGLISRSNAGRAADILLGKVAAKRGKPILVDDFDTNEDFIDFVQRELKSEGLESRDEVIDPRNGRKIPKVLTGNTFIMKLHHTSESKEHGRGLGRYTADSSPSKGSDEGGMAKRLSNQELNASVAHQAYEFINEGALVRGQANPEYWARYMNGHDVPTPKVPVVHQKFIAYLKGMGVNPVKNGTKTKLMLLTDKDTAELAGPRELRNGETVDANKDLKPIAGGLFDTSVFGDGEKWARYQLEEPIPHPLMEDPIRKLMGVTKKDYREIFSGEKEFKKFGSGPKAIGGFLASLNLNREIQLARAQAKDSRKTHREDGVVRLRHLRGLVDRGIDPKDLMLQQVPIIPPVFRPVSRLSGKDAPLIDGMNLLYRDMIDASKSLGEIKKFSSAASNERLAVYDAVQAAMGLREPVDPELRQKRVTGLMARLTGDSPKQSFVHRKLLSGTVDLVGRGVIAPSSDLKLDEVGIPEHQAWDVFRVPILRQLRRQGRPLSAAMREWEGKSPTARKALEGLMDEKMVAMSRAPVLHKFGLLAFRPKLVKGSTVRMNPLVYQGFGADNDGDAVNFHAILKPEAVEEARRKWMPSRALISPRDFKTPMYVPNQDHALGLYRASFDRNDKQRPVYYASTQAAMQAYQRGEINVDTPIRIMQK